MPKSKSKNFDSLEEFFATDLKIFKDGSNTLAVYLGFPDGTMSVSDAESDKQNKNFRKRGGGIKYYDDPEYDATSRDWYKGAIANDGIFVSDVYEDSVTKLPSFTYSVPIKKDGELIAVLGFDLLLTSLQKTFDKLPGNVFVFDTASFIPFVSNDKNLIMKKYLSIGSIMQHYGMFGDYKTFEYNDLDGSKKFRICTQIDNFKAKINIISFIYNIYLNYQYFFKHLAYYILEINLTIFFTVKNSLNYIYKLKIYFFKILR